jgi:hypothetical protein
MQNAALNPGQLVAGKRVLHGTGVAGGMGLDEHNPGFFAGVGPVFHPARHHEYFARVNGHGMVPKINVQLAFHHDEQLVLGFVLMPNKFALYLGQFHVLVVQIRYHVRVPLVSELCKLLR